MIEFEFCRQYTKYNTMHVLLYAQITYPMEINVILILIENQQPRVFYISNHLIISYYIDTI